MPISYMMSSRDKTDDGFGYRKGPLCYFSSDAAADQLTIRSHWTEMSEKDFAKALINTAKSFPFFTDEDNKKQQHLSLFVHGYNNDWKDSVKQYTSIQSQIYSGGGSLGVLVLYTWPSDGNVASYLSDRRDVRACAPDLADALVALHDQIIVMQRAAVRTEQAEEERFCRAKISVIAHSMGGYLMQKALAMASQRLNNPQLVTLIHQLVLVAADMNNDLFQKTQPMESDGSLMANLCYRIAAMYSGLDSVLGASSGLKHFGVRRLGRSGLANNNVFDNVFGVDVTPLIKDTSDSAHSAVFRTPTAMRLLASILQGTDRGLLMNPG